MIRTRVFREGKFLDVSFPAKATDIIDFQRRNYDTPPRMRIAAGLVFQPLDSDLMQAYGNVWKSLGRTEIQYHYGYHILHRLHEKRKGYVLLTRKLTDPVNLYADRYVHRIVDVLNGKTVKDFHHFNELLDQALASEYITIRFINESTPLILKSEDVKRSGPGIMKKYSIRYDRYPAAGEGRK
ncbi:MAG: hypothetical protein OEZ34_07220 [Spirochaetia bacterium]|nr:hypothetical protein [Spirochaetia bacterium]